MIYNEIQANGPRNGRLPRNCAASRDQRPGQKPWADGFGGRGNIEDGTTRISCDSTNRRRGGRWKHRRGGRGPFARANQFCAAPPYMIYDESVRVHHALTLYEHMSMRARSARSDVPGVTNNATWETEDSALENEKGRTRPLQKHATLTN